MNNLKINPEMILEISLTLEYKYCKYTYYPKSIKSSFFGLFKKIIEPYYEYNFNGWISEYSEKGMLDLINKNDERYYFIKNELDYIKMCYPFVSIKCVAKYNPVYYIYYKTNAEAELDYYKLCSEYKIDLKII
jgi:hypothetical protein